MELTNYFKQKSILHLLSVPRNASSVMHVECKWQCRSDVWRSVIKFMMTMDRGWD